MKSHECHYRSNLSDYQILQVLEMKLDLLSSDKTRASKLQTNYHADANAKIWPCKRVSCVTALARIDLCARPQCQPHGERIPSGSFSHWVYLRQAIVREMIFDGVPQDIQLERPRSTPAFQDQGDMPIWPQLCQLQSIIFASAAWMKGICDPCLLLISCANGYANALHVFTGKTSHATFENLFHNITSSLLHFILSPSVLTMSNAGVLHPKQRFVLSDWFFNHAHIHP